MESTGGAQRDDAECRKKDTSAYNDARRSRQVDDELVTVLSGRDDPAAARGGEPEFQ